MNVNLRMIMTTELAGLTASVQSKQPKRAMQFSSIVSATGC